jgi:hypothetical protein
MQNTFSIIKSYDLDNSFDSLIVEKKMLLKMTLPSSKAAQGVKHEDPTKEPYAHLKARNVFGKMSQEYEH